MRKQVYKKRDVSDDDVGTRRYDVGEERSEVNLPRSRSWSPTPKEQRGTSRREGDDVPGGGERTSRVPERASAAEVRQLHRKAARDERSKEEEIVVQHEVEEAVATYDIENPPIMRLLFWCDRNGDNIRNFNSNSDINDIKYIFTEFWKLLEQVQKVLKARSQVIELAMRSLPGEKREKVPATPLLPDLANIAVVGLYSLFQCNIQHPKFLEPLVTCMYDSLIKRDIVHRAWNLNSELGRCHTSMLLKSQPHEVKMLVDNYVTGRSG